MTLYARSANYKRPPRPTYKRARFDRRRPFQGISDRVFYGTLSFLGGLTIVALYLCYKFFVG